MNIYESINQIMTEIGAIGKNSKNQQQGFMYRGVDAVMNALNPALQKCKVFVVPEVLDVNREDRVSQKGAGLIYTTARVRYTFYAEDGSNVQAVVVGEGMDSGDKSCNKAMSIAFKYACFQVFCIPTEEMRDPDAESYEVAPKQLDEVKELGKKKIGKNKQETVLTMAEKDGVDVPLLLGMCKVKDVADITENVFTNIMTHWEEVKTKCPKPEFK